jgi:hypothetical protein
MMWNLEMKEGACLLESLPDNELQAEGDQRKGES